MLSSIMRLTSQSNKARVNAPGLTAYQKLAMNSEKKLFNNVVDMFGKTGIEDVEQNIDRAMGKANILILTKTNLLMKFLSIYQSTICMN